MLSVATLLTLAYGTRVEDAYDRRMTPGSLRAPPKALAPTHRSSREKPGRTVSVIRHGITWLRRLLHRGRFWSRVWLLPEPWPEPKSNLEVTRHAPRMKTPYLPLSEAGGTRYRGHSAVLNLDLCWEDGHLRWYDPVNDRYLRTYDEEAEGRLAAEERIRELEAEVRRLREL